MRMWVAVKGSTFDARVLLRNANEVVELPFDFGLPGSDPLAFKLLPFGADAIGAGDDPALDRSRSASDGRARKGGLLVLR